ncbi:MAG: hypothetical protein HQ495_14300 [Alphaproteobacteria bacterium]|nr:hypothetical protein [Alphaproteobacteria bacterium]
MYRLVFALILAMPSIALAQQSGHEHRPGMDHAVPAETTGSPAPTEPGQATFAAIQEIVSILDADPDTDWSTVNIDALRRHLVDMDNVTLRAEVETAKVDGGFRYVVTGSGPLGNSIARMVKAHAATTSGANGMTMVAEDNPGGAVMTVTAARPEDRIKLAGLGFFGLMTLGAHHQEHHLMIASGQGVHH